MRDRQCAGAPDHLPEKRVLEHQVEAVKSLFYVCVSAQTDTFNMIYPAH